MNILLYRGEAFDPNFYYHAGFDIDHAFLLVGKKLFVSRLNESLARTKFRGKTVVYRKPFAELRKEIKGKTVFADLSSISAKMAQRLGRTFKLKDYSSELLEKRAKKQKKEVAHIRRAAKLTREILHSLDFRSARTELGLEKQIRVATAELGLEPAFDPVVSTDSSTSFPHYRASSKKLGSLVLVDCGVKYQHYCADLTRCFILDGDRKKKQEYEKLQDICHSIVDELPGLRRGKEVAQLSAKLMKRAGFPKMIHAIGHGIGLEVHELPKLGKNSKDKIAGTTVAIEPAFYRRYGMRFEEDVYFDGKRARIL